MILFRGKIDTNIEVERNGEWIEGYFDKMIIGGNERYFIHVFDDGNYRVDQKTVSQYIGIKDKNDIKMFSGDKFRVHSNNIESRYIDKIVRVSPNSLTLEVANLDELKNEDMGQIWQRPQEYWWEDRVGRIEIIGNIYDKAQS